MVHWMVEIFWAVIKNSLLKKFNRQVFDHSIWQPKFLVPPN